MEFRQWLLTKAVKRAGWAEIQAKKMFGPVYHGTSEDYRQAIHQQGFQVYAGTRQTVAGKSHGYDVGEYAAGRPAPVDHIGFGTILLLSRQ